jgi:hypothetical protein
MMKKIAFPGNLSVISETNDRGSLEIIPIMINIEIPLPIPLSVILSPSHIQNIVPAMRIITDVM